MKTFTLILFFSFLFLTGINFVHAQGSCLVSVSPPTTICMGNCLSLSLSATYSASVACANVSYSWSPSAGLSNTIGANTSACPSATTTYTVLACCLSTGCCDTATVTITVAPNPTVGTMNTSVCAGQSAILCANGAVNYSWSNGTFSSCTTVSPTTTSVYCVIGTNANGCTNTSCATATVYTCAGVNETNFSNQINIYPNPFSQSVAIRIDDAQLIPSEFIMYDLLGKEVKCLLIQNAETIIARDKLSTGLYYYRLMQKEQIIDRGKIMIE